jgi:acyl-CoA thioesterase II
MDSRSFLGLEPTHNPFRWKLPVTEGISTAGNFLFGGSGLGAAISALEGTSGRPCVWATAQYLSYAKPGEVLDIDVHIAVDGHQITQARAVCHVADREILTVNAALGHREMESSGQWERMPDGIPGPDECEPRPPNPWSSGSISDRLEERMVKGRPFERLDGTEQGDGQTMLWARLPDVITGVDATTLAILGDFVPMGIGQALGARAGGNSLDNTLRVCRLVATEWVLMDIRVHAVERGFGHGLVHMFAQDGTLMATASQSVIVRFWKSG